MSKWSDKYKRSIDCSNPKGFSQKAHCAGRKKRSLKEAGRPYSAKYMKALIKAGQGKTADTVNVKIPKSGHFMDEEKLNISYLFDQIGIDIIEAGFPAASKGDFEAVKEVSKILKTSIPCGLSRQRMAEFDVEEVIIVNTDNTYKIYPFNEVLPYNFKF